MTIMDLRTQEALNEIQRLRGAGALGPLRREMHAEFSGKRCLVVGSAPSAILPPAASFDACICVNGSPWTLRKMGMGCPDMTVVAGWSTRTDKPVRLETQRIWRGLETRRLFFIETGATAEEGRRVIDACGFRYETFQSIAQIERSVIIGDVCGRELGWGKRDDRVSNGIFSAILAIWGGASEVIIAGISVGGGHAYIKEETPREHQQGDEAFFALASSLPVHLSTTSQELRQRYGFPLIAGVGIDDWG